MLILKFRGIEGPMQLTDISESLYALTLLMEASYCMIKPYKDYFYLVTLRPTNNNRNNIKTNDRKHAN